MPAHSTPVEPFFLSGTQVPRFPALTAHTDLSTDLLGFPTLISHEEILFSNDGAPPIKAVDKPELKSAPTPVRRPRSPTPAHVGDVENSSDQSDLSELSETESTVSSDEKIPKPPGEVGRPGRGGYNIEEALKWAPQDLSRLKKFVHRLVDERLDIEKAISYQSPGLLPIICRAAAAKFPCLEQYADDWPVLDLIKMRLKNTAARQKRLHQKVAPTKEQRSRRARKL